MMPGDLTSVFHAVVALYATPKLTLDRPGLPTVVYGEVVLLISSAYELTEIDCRRMWFVISSGGKLGWIYEHNLNKHLVRRGDI